MEGAGTRRKIIAAHKLQAQIRHPGEQRSRKNLYFQDAVEIIFEDPGLCYAAETPRSIEVPSAGSTI
jgi:hypothetical protein